MTTSYIAHIEANIKADGSILLELSDHNGEFLCGSNLDLNIHRVAGFFNCERIRTKFWAEVYRAGQQKVPPTHREGRFVVKGLDRYNFRSVDLAA